MIGDIGSAAAVLLALFLVSAPVDLLIIAVSDARSRRRGQFRSPESLLPRMLKYVPVTMAVTVILIPFVFIGAYKLARLFPDAAEAHAAKLGRYAIAQAQQGSIDAGTTYLLTPSDDPLSDLQMLPDNGDREIRRIINCGDGLLTLRLIDGHTALITHQGEFLELQSVSGFLVTDLDLPLGRMKIEGSHYDNESITLNEKLGEGFYSWWAGL